MIRLPTPAELGFDVTIAIAAITEPDGYIVTVSDRMISYDNITQAEDNATLKAQKIGDRWGAMFAGNDARLFPPLIDKIVARMREAKNAFGTYDLPDVKQAVTGAFQELFQEQFTATHLSRLGIKNIEEFRKNGFGELGPDVHREVYRELSKFDPGIQLLVYGYDGINFPRLFEVDSPGRVTDHELMKYGVIGSGYWMATASLRRRPLTRQLHPTIYRLLEAKFCAETATGVGKATTALIFGKNDEFASVHPSTVDKIRKIWLKTLQPDAPQAAVNLLKPIPLRPARWTPLRSESVSQDVQLSETPSQILLNHPRQLPTPERSE